jgi:YVTN family beta-propeller protein
VCARPVFAAPFAYIANVNSDAVSVIDLATNLVVATVPVGRAPYGIATDKSGSRVYVVNTLDNTVSVIDTGTRSVIATVGVGANGGNAAGLAINRDGTRVYVANPQDNTLSVVDASTNVVTGAPIAVGECPLGVAVSPSGSQVYVTNSRANSLSIVDTTTNMAIAEFPLGKAPRGVAVHPSGTPVYVATSDGLAIVDPTTARVSTVPVPDAYAVATSPDGASVYVTNADGHELMVVDALTELPAGSPIDVGSSARGVSVTPDGKRIYVVNGGGDTVSVIDARTLTVVNTVNVLSGPAALGNFIADAAPVANDQAVSMAQDCVTPVALTATDAENDPLTFTVTANPTHGTLSGTVPTLTYTPAPDYAGTDSFTFTANDGAADSNVATVSLLVSRGTSTSVTSSLNPSIFGQAITLTAVVTGGVETPTGSVQFFDGAVPLGASSLRDGSASLTTAAIGAGSRSITAVYTPTKTFAPSASTSWMQTVDKATGTMALTVSAFTPQYSDVETFKASFTPSATAGPAPVKVAFKVGSQTVGEATPTLVNGVYQYAWTGQLIEPTPTRQMKPDYRIVSATVVDPNFAVTSAVKAITIQKEDARVAYSGPTSVSLHGSATGTVPLSVTVRDITAVAGDAAWDPNAGDIRNAQVSFIDRSTNMILATVPVTLSGDDTKTGVASYNWAVNLGTSKSKSYTIGFMVGYYYNRYNIADNALIVVSK